MKLELRGGGVAAGLPSLALSISDSMPVILAVCLLRGLGFGLAVVVGGAPVATLIPPQRRGEGLGVYGVVVGVRAVVGLPAGMWLAGRFGYSAVFVIGMLFGLLGPIAVITGMLRFGITQSASLTMMYGSVPVSGYGTVSAMWNFANYAALGAGAGADW
jgi:MFS family permease